MPTTALDLVDFSWAPAAGGSASPALNEVNFSWLVISLGAAIEPVSARLKISGGILIEPRIRTATVLRAAALRLSYGSHDLAQAGGDALYTIRSRTGPHLSAGRPTLTFRLRPAIRGAGGVRLGVGQPQASLNVHAASAALTFGRPTAFLALGASSITLTMGAGHTLRQTIRVWPTNVLRAGTPSIAKGSAHP